MRKHATCPERNRDQAAVLVPAVAVGNHVELGCQPESGLRYELHCHGLTSCHGLTRCHAVVVCTYLQGPILESSHGSGLHNVALQYKWAWHCMTGRICCKAKLGASAATQPIQIEIRQSSNAQLGEAGKVALLFFCQDAV